MKKIIKPIMGLMLLSIALISCEEEEKNPLSLLDPENIKAPYVRIVVDETIVAAGDIADSSFNGEVNALDGNVQSWELSVSRESGGIASDTIPLTTITSFPSTISIPYTDIASGLGISINDISGGDFIRFLGKSTGTDGAVFTFENFTGSITGQQEQRQAYNFIVLIKCSPISDTPIAGTWTIDMDDLYGDGWDGAFVSFEIDGITTNYTFSAGSEASFTVDVPENAGSLVISYTSGAFEEEHVYTITTPNGEVRGPFGPNPSPCIN